MWWKTCLYNNDKYIYNQFLLFMFEIFVSSTKENP